MKIEKIYGCGELNLTPRFVTRNKDATCPCCNEPVRLFNEYETRGILGIERALTKNYLDAMEIINRINDSCRKLRKTNTRDDLKPNMTNILDDLYELDQKIVAEWVQSLR